MFRQTIFALVLGLVGTGMLVGLGVWQMQRLEWKEGIIAGACGDDRGRSDPASRHA